MIICELLISCFGVPIDAAGAATKASIMTNVLCPFVAFIHTLLGNFMAFVKINELWYRSYIQVSWLNSKSLVIYIYRNELLMHHCCHGYNKVSIRCTRRLLMERQYKINNILKSLDTFDLDSIIHICYFSCNWIWRIFCWCRNDEVIFYIKFLITIFIK